MPSAKAGCKVAKVAKVANVAKVVETTTKRGHLGESGGECSPMFALTTVVFRPGGERR